MDNVGLVVESLDTAIAFFAELGLQLEGRATIEGESSTKTPTASATSAAPKASSSASPKSSPIR